MTKQRKKGWKLDPIHPLIKSAGSQSIYRAQFQTVFMFDHIHASTKDELEAFISDVSVRFSSDRFDVLWEILRKMQDDVYYGRLYEHHTEKPFQIYNFYLNLSTFFFRNFNLSRKTYALDMKILCFILHLWYPGRMVSPSGNIIY